MWSCSMAALQQQYTASSIGCLKHTSMLSLQARKLRSELAQLNLPADTLWVTSPLSRAIETLLLGCPTAHLLRQAPGGGAAAGSSVPSASTASTSTENSAAAPNGGSGQPPRIMVLPCISEKVSGCWHLACVRESGACLRLHTLA